MEGAVVARAIHVASVVLWIGGVAMATTIVLPLVRAGDQPIERRVPLFEAIEHRFVGQARIATVLVGLSGFYMIESYDLWSRFASLEYWWMPAMVGLWLIFTLMLFVAEPLVLHRWVRAQVLSGNERVLAALHWFHWILLAMSLVVVLAAVADSHEITGVP